MKMCFINCLKFRKSKKPLPRKNNDLVWDINSQSFVSVGSYDELKAVINPK